MPKIKLEDLAKIKEKAQKTTALREGGPYKTKVTVHMGTCGIAAGARGILDTLMKDTITLGKDGWVTMPQKSGLGLEIDWDRVAKQTTAVIT